MYRYKLMSQYQYRKIDVNNLIKVNFNIFLIISLVKSGLRSKIQI